MKRLPIPVLLPAIAFTLAAVEAPPPAGNASVEAPLRKGLDFYASIMVRAPYGGGFPRAYMGDYNTGEAGEPIPKDSICIQDPATPAGGTVFLRAGVEFDKKYLDTAREVGNLLVASLTPSGGWGQEMWVGPERPVNCTIYPGKKDWGGVAPTEHGDAIYDDGTTFNAAEFLYGLWWHTKEQKYFDAWKRAMDGLLANQHPKGSFPQVGGRGGYHAYATFNDFAMTNCVATLVKAYQRTGEKKYIDAVLRCGDWVCKVQTPSGGYATQYDGSDKIAGARKFEPPGLGPDATSWAIGILCVCYDWSGDPKYVQPIGKAVDWLQRVKMGGKWARFYHPDSDRPWYRSIDGRDVGSSSQAKPGYSWDGAWGNGGISRGNAYKGRGRGSPRTVRPGGTPGAGVELRAGTGGKFSATVEEAISSQDERGAWIQGGGRSGGGKGAAVRLPGGTVLLAAKGGGRGRKGGGGSRPIITGYFVACANALMDARGGAATAAEPEEPAEPEGPAEPAEPGEPEPPAEPTEPSEEAPAGEGAAE